MQTVTLDDFLRLSKRVKELTTAAEQFKNSFSIWITMTDDDPSSIFGGKWDKIEGRFLLSAGTETVGATGGEAAVTLTALQVPNLKIPLGIGGTIGYANANDRAARMANCTATDTSNFYTAGGGGGSHNNMPPYMVVNIWKRIE